MRLKIEIESQVFEDAMGGDPRATAVLQAAVKVARAKGALAQARLSLGIAQIEENEAIATDAKSRVWRDENALGHPI